MPAKPARATAPPEQPNVHPGDELVALQARLEQVEAFSAQVGQAIESVVSNVLQLRDEQLAKLNGRVKELEAQLYVERTHRDLSDVSRMHPKARRVVFVSGRAFADNVKYSWLAMRERAASLGVEAWYLPFDARHEQQVRALGATHCLPAAYDTWSSDHVATLLSCAVVVTSDHLLHPNPHVASLLAGARHVQLWHGVSIKEIGLKNLPALKGLNPRVARLLNTCGRYASLVGTAQAAEGEWRRWFAFERYAALGYPRNDVLHRAPTQADMINVDRAAFERAAATRASGHDVFLYAPTFRDAQRARWLLGAGIDKAARAVADRGGLLLVNLHPVEQPHLPELRQALPQVAFVEAGSDPYPLLRQTSALITDYSSLMFDYLQLDRPVLLYRPDHTEYTTKSRRLFDDKLESLPGPLLRDAAGLARALGGKLDAFDAPFAASRAALREQLFDHCDAGASARVADLIADEVERALSVPAAGDAKTRTTP